jgi:hypothetical protein
MNIWLVVVVLWYVLGLGIHLGKHGQTMQGKYNFWSALITTGILLFLIYKAVSLGI